MTAEVVVMNREGVAMAADSAVTIGEGPKILNTVNKVFMLAPGYSVGILVYNNAAFMAVPWEIIIKSYRDEIVKSKIYLLKLEDYATDFFEFIEKNGSKFVSEDQEFGFFEAATLAEFQEVVKNIWNRIKHIFYDKAEISDVEIEEIIQKTTNEYHTRWNKCLDIFEKEKVEPYRKSLSEKFDKKLDEIINSVFEKFPISEEVSNKLKEIAILKLSKAVRINYISGIVFAGYGQDDLYPKCVEYHVYNYLCKVLVYIRKDITRIGFSAKDKDTIAAIIPFAQDDVAHNVLSGRLPSYEKQLKEKLIGKMSKDEVEKILSEVNTAIWNQHTQPIINTVSILPKDELASVARTLVNLTSFMRKVSSDIETVGGPVDVAVISKKDGFIWIDRKHYFDIDKNIHFRYER
jgi:hypothetical protein